MSDHAHSPIQTTALRGIEAVPVSITVEILRRLPALVIVGLPPAHAKETAVRVRSAIQAAGFTVPRRRILVTLDQDHEGEVPTGGADLAVALAILVADGQLPPASLVAHGELSFRGAVRHTRGAVAAGYTADRLGVPFLRAPVNLALSDNVWALRDLADAATALDDAVYGAQKVPVTTLSLWAGMWTHDFGPDSVILHDGGTGAALAHARGYAPAQRPDSATAREIYAIRDAAGLVDLPLITPLRAPHHSTSVAAMLGLGCPGRPGELALAHGGTLYLDETLEFRRATLDVVIRTLSDGHVCGSRDGVRFPARFRLVLNARSDSELATLRNWFPDVNFGVIRHV